jgi:hypothetical protein
MPLMSTCVGRLGSRFSILLDPVRREVHYGALGLMCQSVGEWIAGVDDRKGRFTAFPLGKAGDDFHNVDQHQTMTSVVYEGNCLAVGVRVRMEIVAPFWPQDEATSLVPAYVVNFRVSRLARVRWSGVDPAARRKGVLRFALRLPGVRAACSKGMVRLRYAVQAGQRMRTGEGGTEQRHGTGGRRTATRGQSTDLLVPLTGGFRPRRGFLEAPFDVSGDAPEQAFSLAVVGYCGDALFERFGRAMRLKYAAMWPDAAAVAAFVKAHHAALCRKSRAFDALWLESALPAAAQDLTALAFQSYLMNTLWAVGDDGREWFSVWEGSCWFNSTVDVTYNEAMFYFACWPELMEMIFEEWSHHANDAEADRRRRRSVSDGLRFGAREEDFAFPGAILQHDMGAGWTANGQSYHHLMPVEENANFLLMLYAHGKWWGREKLYRTYRTLNRRLVEYLLWTDSTGNGFADRGTANTIDDATPAVQYGRDNVYLGIKRLAALHAAGRMLADTGDEALARRCRAEVRKAVRTLNAGWLGDHFGVCLDKSAKGLVDCWSGEPLPYRTLPGWDAYSLYTTNGLLYLMMVDDLPAGLRRERFRQDVVSACRASMTRYGCGHSSLDTENLWVSMNVWRDCAAGYLGEHMLAHCQRYWNQQLFGNGGGSEKPNCFTETSLTNNLVWYPRGAAAFGLMMSTARLTIDRRRRRAAVRPIADGRWPLLPLADWKAGKVPFVVRERVEGRTAIRVEGPTGRTAIEVGK